MNTPVKTELNRVVAYVNTTRIHWLVEELQKIGINEIMVSEFFRPNCQISKVEFFCEEKLVEEARCLIHKIGNSGKSADHLFFIYKIEGNEKSIFPFM